jgi:hypothetical protein
VNKWDAFQTQRWAYVLWTYLLTKTKAHGWFKDKKKAMKLPHPTWKICCSKHMSNRKELHTMLHHQQLTIVIVTTWIIKKNVKSWNYWCRWDCTNVLSMYTRLDAHLINVPNVCHKKEACLSMCMTFVQ